MPRTMQPPTESHYTEDLLSSRGSMGSRIEDAGQSEQGEITRAYKIGGRGEEDELPPFCFGIF